MDLGVFCHLLLYKLIIVCVMKLELYYDEIVSYVERNFLIRPQLVCVDESSIDVMYRVNRFLPAMTVRVRVDECCNGVVSLSYECSAAMSMMISGAIGHLGNDFVKGVDIDTEKKRVMVRLGEIDVLEKPLKYVELDEISFYDSHMGVTASLK